MTKPSASRKSRREALAEVRTRFIGKRHPRLVILTFISCAGLAALGVSMALFRLGVDHIGFRYLLATVSGYGVFLLLIRIWIELHRPSRDGVDLDVPDLDIVSTDAGAAFSGGSSGGGGASGHWGGADIPVVDLDVPDVDEGWPVVVAIAVAAVVFLGAVFAILYVVYYAPVLLAEVALDAALVTGLYRRLRKQDTGHWLWSAIRHTWKPATAVGVCLYVIGVVVQWAVPSARTIGDVLR
jgi:hypothetical protein